MCDCKLHDKLFNIVAKANELIMNVYSQNDFETKYKEDNSPVTLADTVSSNWIICELRTLNADFNVDIPIICEETKLQSYEERKDYSYFWLVDPLDGTKEFIKRNGEFTVNIALIVRNKQNEYVPMIGYVGVPAQNQIYYAIQGNGAWKCTQLEKKAELYQPLECIPFDISEPVNIVCSRTHLNKETAVFSDKFNVKDIILSGSSIKFMKLCENEAQVYPRLHPCMEWDIAAADAILREAGGVVLTPAGQVMPYNKPNLLVESFIAYGKTK